MSRLRPKSTLQSQKWQLIGVSNLTMLLAWKDTNYNTYVNYSARGNESELQKQKTKERERI